MSLTFKLLSLVIRTAAKPIGNYIKRQAHEHEGFRRFAINQAQRVHRIDMRLRLGLLHDPEAQQRMHEREQKAAEEKRQKEQAPTVRSELEQKKYDDQKAREEKEGKKKEEQPKKKSSSRPKIRPLSDARAIELGANFFSETFIFLVAVGLLLAENFRSKRAASNRRDEIQDRLESVEAQLERLKQEHNLPELEAPKSKESRPSWWNPAGWWRRSQPPPEDREGTGDGTSAIPGSVPGPSPEAAVKSTVVEKIEPTSNAPHARIDAIEADTKKR